MKHKTLLWIFALIFIISSASMAVNAALTDDLLAYYEQDLDTTNATTSNDSSGNNRHATLANIDIGQTGILGNATLSDSNSDLMQHADIATSTAFTINFWVYRLGNGGGNEDVISAQAWDGTGRVRLMMKDTGTSDFAVQIYNGGSDTNTGYTIPNNAWHMVTVTIDDVTNNVSIYMNGTLMATAAPSISSIRIPMSMHKWGHDANQWTNTRLDEVGYWNRTLTTTEITQLWNGGAGIPYPLLPTGPVNTTLNITAVDNWNTTALQDFNVSISWSNGTTETDGTSTGYVDRIFVTNSSLTANISFYGMTDYFNLTLYDQEVQANISNTIQGSVYQAIACFNATEMISNNSVTPDNITIDSTVRTSCFNLSVGSYNVMASKAGWDTQNQTFNITALSNATYTIEDMGYNTFIVFAKDIKTGAYLSNYQLNVTSIAYPSWAGKHYASTTNQSIALINGTYNVLIDATGYALQDTEANVSVQGDTNYTFNLYPTNSLNITFYDEADGTALTSVNVTFEIILDDANATIAWTNDSTYWVDGLDAGDYEIRYRATTDGYGERSYYFTLTNRTYNALSLYLLNDSSTESITTTLYDEYGNTLEGYTIRLLRYYASLSGYVVVDEGQTNSEGVTIVSAIRNGPYYKFRIVDPDGDVLKTTSATQIYDTSISLYVTLGEGIGETLTNLNGISYELVYLTASNQFRFTWDASDGLLVSVTTYVYETDALNGDTLHNSSTSTSASGTMYIGIAAENDTTYKAMSYVTFTDDTEPTLLDTLSVSFDEPLATFGKLGLFLTFIIVVTFALTGIFNPAAPCILVPLAMIITRIARLHALEWTWIVAITAVGAIILYIIRDKT